MAWKDRGGINIRFFENEESVWGTIIGWAIIVGLILAVAHCAGQ